jgi:hypothetical protein
MRSLDASLADPCGDRTGEVLVGGLIPSAVKDSSGWTIHRADAEQLKRRPPAGDKRKAYMVRPKLDRAAAWEAAAKRRGLTVGVSLLELADRESGWREP